MEEDYIEELRKRKEACVKECNALTKELAALTAFETKKKIAGITLSTDKRLIDLLIERILDPLPDWRTKIDTLIRIPWGDAGRDFLRGGDYFEALFQLAIAIGEMPQFKNVKQFYDIEGYKTKTKKKNYLYTKSVKNSGGGQTGIADIMFEVDIGKGGVDDEQTKTAADLPSKGPPKYSCGEIPPEITANQNPIYFITVKGFIKEHSISQSYDIPLLETQINYFPELKNRHIVVCVRNKEKFLQKLGRTKMDFLKNSIDHVIGYEEVMDVFDAFRTRFFISMGETPRTITNIMKKVYQMFPNKENPDVKPSLSMYFHQELVATSVVMRIQEVKVKQQTGPHFLCIGVLPRGGKSFIAGGIIDMLRKQKLLQQKDATFNVLFLSSAISETLEQFEGDLITKYAEFSDFKFIDARKKGEYDKNTKNAFVFMSRQLTSKNVKGEDDVIEINEDEEVSLIQPESTIITLLREKLGNELPSFDICFFDEAHVGIKSEKVQETFNGAFKEFKMPVVMMTATYLNPSIVLNGSTKDLFVWDTSDIKEMRKLPVFGFDGFLNNTHDPPDFIRRNPELVKRLIDIRRGLGETEQQIAKPYINFPDEYFISLTFDEKAKAKFTEMNDGFRISEAFKLQDEKTPGVPDLLDHNQYTVWWKRLTNKALESAGRIKQYLTPEEETLPEGETPILIGEDRKYRALNKIFRLAYESGSRPIPGQPFSILMFLPNVKDKGADAIGEVSRVWASFLHQSPYWRQNFVFLTLSVITNPKYKPYKVKTLEANVKERGILHREDYSGMKLKELIQTVEYEALKLGKGLVILSGDVGKMGISLKCVDIVCLFTDTTSPDDIIQKAYRAMTDDPPSKKYGFIIDFNIKRTLIAKFKYAKAKQKTINEGKNVIITEEDTEQLIKKTFENSNWGQDAFIEDLAARGGTIGMINQKLKDIILNEVLLKERSIDKDELKKKQVDILFGNVEFQREIRRVLKNTKEDKGQKENEALLERGTLIPGPTAAVQQPQPIPVDQLPKEEIQLTDEQIKAKMGDIILTFINSLVIRSSNSWESTFSFPDLIQKFETDKETAKTNCDCKTPVCKTPHTNLYEIAFCEIKPYAYSPSKVYLKEIHEGIMNLLSKMFHKDSDLADEWQMYMDQLVRDLRSKRGGRRKSWKKRLSKGNGRKTHRNGA